MANTYTLISSQTLASTAASVTFSTIPSTYTDLCLKASIRTNDASTSSYFRMTINGDSGTNYGNRRLTGTGSAASSGNNSGQVWINAVYVASNGDTANTFGSTEIYIPSYNSTASKPMNIFTTEENNATASNIQLQAGLYIGTSAITSTTLLNVGSTLFLAGSSFYLYGIKNS